MTHDEPIEYHDVPADDGNDDLSEEEEARLQAEYDQAHSDGEGQVTYYHYGLNKSHDDQVWGPFAHCVNNPPKIEFVVKPSGLLALFHLQMMAQWAEQDRARALKSALLN